MSDFWGSWPRKYQEDELEESLRRAFSSGETDFIYIDSRRYRFLIESACLGVEKGWLTETVVEIDEQYTQVRYRLTDEGKKHFVGKPAPPQPTRWDAVESNLKDEDP